MVESLTPNRATAPRIYSGNFGDCLAGKSVLEVTRFDVAYDAGNGTLALHLDGTSSVKNEFVSRKLCHEGVPEFELIILSAAVHRRM